jgi:hypothetical protein
VPELAAAVASWAARAVVLAARLDAARAIFIVGSNLQANANNAVNTANTNNGQININSQNLNILSSQDTNNTRL